MWEDTKISTLQQLKQKELFTFRTKLSYNFKAIIISF